MERLFYLWGGKKELQAGNCWATDTPPPPLPHLYHLPPRHLCTTSLSNEGSALFSRAGFKATLCPLCCGTPGGCSLMGGVSGLRKKNIRCTHATSLCLKTPAFRGGQDAMTGLASDGFRRRGRSYATSLHRWDKNRAPRKHIKTLLRTRISTFGPRFCSRHEQIGNDLCLIAMGFSQSAGIHTVRYRYRSHYA